MNDLVSKKKTQSKYHLVLVFQSLQHIIPGHPLSIPSFGNNSFPRTFAASNATSACCHAWASADRTLSAWSRRLTVEIKGKSNSSHFSYHSHESQLQCCCGKMMTIAMARKNVAMYYIKTTDGLKTNWIWDDFLMQLSGNFGIFSHIHMLVDWFRFWSLCFAATNKKLLKSNANVCKFPLLVFPHAALWKLEKYTRKYLPSTCNEAMPGIILIFKKKKLLQKQTSTVISVLGLKGSLVHPAVKPTNLLLLLDRLASPGQTKLPMWTQLGPPQEKLDRTLFHKCLSNIWQCFDTYQLQVQ